MDIHFDLIRKNKDNITIAFVDGSCIGNGKSNAKGGIGIYYLFQESNSIS